MGSPILLAVALATLAILGVLALRAINGSVRWVAVGSVVAVAAIVAYLSTMSVPILVQNPTTQRADVRLCDADANAAFCSEVPFEPLPAHATLTLTSAARTALILFVRTADRRVTCIALPASTGQVSVAITSARAC